MANHAEWAQSQRKQPERSEFGGLASEQAPTRVLICDDEHKLARLTAALLEQVGCHTLTTTSADAAIAAVGTVPEPFHVLLLDVGLKGALADSVLDELSARGAATRVILTSGYPEEYVPDRLMQHSHVARFLAKPYRIDELVDAISAAKAR
jgi:DNA-binding NtrC family response regulator